MLPSHFNKGTTMKNRYQALGVLMLGVAGSASAQNSSAWSEAHTWIVTASNTTANQLLVYSPAGKLLKTIVTGGQGGVGGNAGGIAQDHRRLAVVNFGSGTVSVFVKDLAHANLRLESVIQAVASPVSLAFGDDHLYILSTTNVESHPIDRNGTIGVAASPDGVAGLLHADASAAQVGQLPGQLIITEKSNVIETVNLNGSGAVTGSATLVSNIPANVNAPFGLVTRGNDAYVTIAHANEVSLVRHNQVRTVTSSGTQSAPCWLALDGPYLYSSNSPSQSVSRYLVYGNVITQQVAVAASLNGNPTDITYRSGLAAVIDGNATAGVSHLSTFHVDEDGTLAPYGVATITGVATNGVAIVSAADDDRY
jgi:hypothetical protein